MRLSANRVVALGTGAAAVLAGVLGALVSDEIGFAAEQGALLLAVFEVNPLQNLVHLLLGGALLGAGLAPTRVAKRVVTTAGMVCLALGFAGLAVAGGAPNPLALNGADNVLHFAGASLLLAVGLGGDKPASASAATSEPDHRP